MAGLTAAWRLSGPTCRDSFEVTVYQRGWRLGGKGASGRGIHGRIEEHGLHVWLGYYENAFRLMHELYRELDRPSTDPTCTITGIEQAFAPMRRVGVLDATLGSWSDWVAEFAPSGGFPGRTARRATASTTTQLATRALTLLFDFAKSLPDGSPSTVTPGPIVLSGSPAPPAPPRPAPDRMIRFAEIGSLTAVLEALRLMSPTTTEGGQLSEFLTSRIDELGAFVFDRLGTMSDSRRIRDFVDFLLTFLRGAIRDGLLSYPDGFAGINHLDLREWLHRHGATEQTCNSPLIRGVYDIAFAYQQGDFSKPRIEAGHGLMYIARMFFGYHGAMFWQMQAGMGDVVFAPLYQALHARGVRFEFFHRLDQVHLAADRSRIAALTFGTQADLEKGSEYRPLTRVGDLPCFPSAPLVDQLNGTVPADLDSHWCDRAREGRRTIAVDRDFDDVVLAVSLGMIPHTCSELLAHSPGWRRMVEKVATVATQSLQVWMTPNEVLLGWTHIGTAISGYPPPFDSFASMSHLIDAEQWPEGHRPGTIAYFCSVLDEAATDDPEIAHKVVKANSIGLLSSRGGHFWPGAVGPDGRFDWSVLHSAGDPTSSDEAALDSQYWRANTDPSDRYVQSLPGSSAHRLRTDGSGWPNLYLAGDWIDNGHNGGCIEAAVVSGLQAANAVRGRPLTKGVRGDYRPAER